MSTVYYIVADFNYDLYWDDLNKDWTYDRDECTYYDDEDDAYDQSMLIGGSVEKSWK